ncbi:shikimate kinase [Aquiflexum sp.]|uniref:shikimate kinase n=1 Tax=Aquiflexum sp. TaxID=1872584 RepID=UPI003592F95E
MRTPLKIVLVGMPGSGKSTFGKKLAKQLSFVFVDLDQVIEKETGKSIEKIFAEEGEGKFRDLESFYLERCLSEIEGFVLATGGGTPCFNDNMDLINKESVSIFLDVSLNEIFHRLHSDHLGKRPMFAGLDEGEIILKLKNLEAERESYYQQAKIKLSGDNISTEHLMSEILTYFRN